MENAGICISCKERPIQVKKWRRCQRCYQRYRLKKVSRYHNGRVMGVPIHYVSEVDFIRIFFNHNNWMYQPANFRFDGEKYQPDFYDGERNVFIEVVGTRQAFHDNKEKYKKFVEAYPKINFEIRLTTGVLIDLNAEKQHIT